MNNAQYWKLRHLQRMDEYHKDADQVIGKVLEAYQDAIEELNSQMRKILNTYSATSKITTEEALQNLTLTQSKSYLDNLRNTIDNIQDEDLRREMLTQINAPAYRARLTRIQAIKDNLSIEVKKIADVQIREMEKGLFNMAQDVYYKTIYDAQQRIGLGFSFADIPTKQIEEILKNNWSGKHFSERIWEDTNALSSELQHTLTKGFMAGTSIKKMSDEISERMNVGKYQATRLMRTEATYIANAAELASYKEAGIIELQYLATLDLRTSDICRKFDGKKIPVDKAIPGKNVPPLHPNCRSTTIEVFDDEVSQGLERRARDPQTGKNILIPANMNYNDWNKIYVKGTLKRETWDKKHLNSDIIKVDKKPVDKKVMDAKVAEFVDKIKNLNVTEYTNRSKMAKDILKNLGLEGLKVSIRKIKDHGFFRFGYNPDTSIVMSEYVLNSADKRSNSHKIKTAFHEAFHARGSGLLCDFRKMGENWLNIEEPFAECAAHFMAKQVGIAEVAPSYGRKLINMLPRLKQLDDFKDCSTLADFGEVAWTKRLNGTPAQWEGLYNDCMKIKHDWFNYSKQYFEYMDKNVDELLDVALDNSIDSKPYKANMLQDWKTIREKVEKGNSTLSTNELWVYEGVFSVTLNRLGVK